MKPVSYTHLDVYKRQYQERAEGGWAPVVEDAKGVRTPEYIIKRKLMLYLHGIRVREV